MSNYADTVEQFIRQCNSIGSNPDKAEISRNTGITLEETTLVLLKLQREGRVFYVTDYDEEDCGWHCDMSDALAN